MPTSQAQTPYITPYIIHQHFGYGDPSVNNYRYSYFSSATRSAFPHSGGVAHPITTQYHHGFARDTLIGIITNLILLKPNVSPSPIRARRSRAHDPTFDKLGNVWGGRDIAYINTTVGKVKGFMVAVRLIRASSSPVIPVVS